MGVPLHLRYHPARNEKSANEYVPVRIDAPSVHIQCGHYAYGGVGGYIVPSDTIADNVTVQMPVGVSKALWGEWTTLDVVRLGTLGTTTGMCIILVLWLLMRHPSSANPSHQSKKRSSSIQSRRK